MPTSVHEEGAEGPWIETAAGGLFFVNALLVAPLAMVMVPLVLGAVLRGTGLLEGPAPALDVLPAAAHYFAPRLGWLAAPAAWLAVRNLRMLEPGRNAARRALLVFLGAHLAVTGYTLWRWITG